MAISYLSRSGAENTSRAGSITVPRPTALMTESIVLVVVTLESSATLKAATTGLTELTQWVDSTNRRFGIFYALPTVASYEITWSGTAESEGLAIAYGGVDTTAPINAWGRQASETASKSMVAPSVTTTVAGCKLVFLGVESDGTSATFPSGMVVRQENTDQGVLGMHVADIAQVSAGATGTKAATLGALAWNSGTMVALKPGGPLLFEGSSLGEFEIQAAKPSKERREERAKEVSDPLGSGKTVFEFTVYDQDIEPETPTDNPRAQAVSPSFIEDGDELWMATKVLIPKTFPEVELEQGWCSLLAFYGPPFEGSGPWEIAINKGLAGGEEEELRFQRNETYGYDVPWLIPVIKGSWVEVMLHFKFSETGWVEMWINGTQIHFFKSGSSYNPNKVAETTKLEMKTRDETNNGGNNSWRTMQYRKGGMFEVGSTYAGPLRVGLTKASVE